jgi:phosphatidylserine/phosphatidylglycerophosphate/cardiolipin synthase-like enzyme
MRKLDTLGTAVTRLIRTMLLVALALGTPLACSTTGGGPRSVLPPKSTPTALPDTSPPGSETAAAGKGPQPPGLLIAGSTSNPADFRGSFQFTDGVTVAVIGIERTKAAKATSPEVEKGAAIQALSIRVTNDTEQALRLSPRPVMTYGPKNRTAAHVRGGFPSTLSGSLPPGASRTGTLTFAVPREHLHRATLRLSPTARHAPAVFSGSLGYSPTNSVLFNDPSGSSADQLRITRHIERLIDGAPAGSTIRIVQYSFDIENTRRKLTAAYQRGVHIQMIVDQHGNKVTKQTTALIELLGSNRKKKSFLVRCGASCMSNRTSTMHAKYYLFSMVGSSRRVSLVGSANITHTNSKGSWNDMQTIVGDATLYNSLTRYFTDMAPDANNRDYYRTTTSGRSKLYFFPRAEKHRVLLLTALDRVSCSGAAPGYGNDGQTLIQVTMYSWRAPRLDIAERLWTLHDRGCEVQIILNRGRTDLAVKQVLARRSAKQGVMDLYDAWVDHNGNNVAERYMHQKCVTISGTWNGRPNVKVVYSGSQNFAPLSTSDNNELVLRRFDDAAYDAYAKNFSYAAKKGAYRFS